MRDLNECKAEIFRRSEKKIKEKKKIYNRMIALSLPLCLILTVCTFAILPLSVRRENDGLNSDSSAADLPQESMCANLTHPVINNGSENNTQDITDNDHAGEIDTDLLDNFGENEELDDIIERHPFSLTWGCYGISSYDSKSAKLVKTTDATRPEDYITSYKLTLVQAVEIISLIYNLDIESYPDEYDPHDGNVASDPSMTLVLSVEWENVNKTVSARDIAYTFGCEDPRGQEFLDVCKRIIDILTESDEWKALPEYEFFYD